MDHGPLAQQQLATAYRGGGGVMDLMLLEGERHTFVNDHPFAANSVKAVEAMKAFIRNMAPSSTPADGRSALAA